MKISKKDALSWFEFLSQLPAGEQLLVKQQEIVYATFAQIEAVVIKKKRRAYGTNSRFENIKGQNTFLWDQM